MSRAKAADRLGTAAAPTLAIRKVGVIGAGTMGSGIAQKLAMEGAEVVLADQGDAYLEKARKGIAGLLEEGVQRRVLRPEDAASTLRRLAFTTELERLADADLVIEAIFEDEGAKRDLFSRLDSIVDSKAVFATNTSSLSVASLAKETRRQERFLGMHWFFHPVKNRLVELIPIEETDPTALRALLEFSRASGKTPILVKDTPGFAVNRFFVPWLNEAARILEEGAASTATVDAAARAAFGIGMGPFALMNATGVPIACHAADGLSRSLGAFYAPSERLRRQVKSKAPWDLSGEPDPAAFDAVSERLWGVAFWVAAKLAAEGGASREDIDRGARIGLRWEHGPFEEMNRLGLPAAAERVRRVCGRHSLEFPPGLREQAGKKWDLRYVEILKRDGVARIVLDRPETLNALDEALAEQLRRAVENAEADPEVRGIVLEGRGKAFMAGADVKLFVRAIVAGDLDGIVRFTAAGHELLRRIERCAKPVVALIDGAALGGGTELALACRARVATPRAMFRLPETGLGIYPGLGGTQRLPRLVGRELARYYILTGVPIGASEAEAAGLVDSVLAPEAALDRAERLARSGEARPRPAAGDRFASVRDLFSDGRVAELLGGKAPPAADPALAKAVQGLARKAPLALKIAAELIDAGSRVSLEEGLELELGRIREIFQTADAREGLTALLERRAAAFKGS